MQFKCSWRVKKTIKSGLSIRGLRVQVPSASLNKKSENPLFPRISGFFYARTTGLLLLSRWSRIIDAVQIASAPSIV